MDCPIQWSTVDSSGAHRSRSTSGLSRLSLLLTDEVLSWAVAGFQRQAAWSTWWLCVWMAHTNISGNRAATKLGCKSTFTKSLEQLHVVWYVHTQGWPAFMIQFRLQNRIVPFAYDRVDENGVIFFIPTLFCTLFYNFVVKNTVILFWPCLRDDINKNAKWCSSLWPGLLRPEWEWIQHKTCRLPGFHQFLAYIYKSSC